MKIPSTVNTDTDNKVSGAGAEVTALAESLQAYACATRQYLGKDLTSITEITPQTIQDADCDRPLQKCLDGLDANWYYSVITTANQIFQDVPGSKSGRNFMFLRGRGVVNQVYAEFGRLKEGSGIKGDDKWNPADIWMVKKSFRFQGGWPTLNDYNRYIYDEFAKTNLIGISLKKLAPKSSAHSKIFNNGKPLLAKFTGIKLGPNMTASKDIYIKYNAEGSDGEVQFRNFSSRPVPGSWQGEIKGKAAAGGKIGGGVAFGFALDAGVPRTKLSFPNQTPIERPTDSDFKTFAMMFKELSGSKEKVEALALQAKVGHKQDKTWWMSKYIGIHLIYTLIKEKKADEFCKQVFSYASSATKNSSIFIKYS